jgi:hypothetical protein
MRCDVEETLGEILKRSRCGSMRSWRVRIRFLLKFSQTPAAEENSPANNILAQMAPLTREDKVAL